MPAWKGQGGLSIEVGGRNRVLRETLFCGMEIDDGIHCQSFEFNDPR